MPTKYCGSTSLLITARLFPQSHRDHHLLGAQFTNICKPIPGFQVSLAGKICANVADFNFEIN